ncbi:hypothetical protein BKA81DRAFT_410927 [Phyllosticta paracitricarpa]
MYEVRQVTGRGMAVFATRDICRGTFIMVEAPILVMENGMDASDEMQVFQQYTKLTAQDMPKYLSLYAADNFVQKALDNLRTKFEAGQVDARTMSYSKLIARVAGVARTNSYSVQEGHFASAVFLEQSRVNHSCLYNASYDFKLERGVQALEAVRDIVAGEEITTCYTAVDGQNQSNRATILQAEYGFDCRCPLCEIAKFPTLKDRQSPEDFALLRGEKTKRDNAVRMMSHWISFRASQNSRITSGLDMVEAFDVTIRIMERRLTFPYADEAGRVQTADNIVNLKNALVDLKRYIGVPDCCM